MKNILSDSEFIESCMRVSEKNFECNIIVPQINECKKRITKREKYEIPKEKIVIIKQQPNKEKEKIVSEIYIPTKRTYTKGSNLPENINIKPKDIPDYCYYVPANKNRSDGFCCGKLHPKQKDKNTDWKTTRSKHVTIEEKFQQLLDYIKEKETNV